MLGTNSGFNKLTVIIPYLPDPAVERNLLKLISNGLDIGVNIILCVDTNDQVVIDRLYAFLPSIQDLKIVFEENKSPGFTRNMGLEFIKTEYFTFWDSDDQIRPLEFSNYLDMIYQNNPEIAVARFGYANSTVVTPNWTYSATLNELFIADNPGLWRWTFRTEHFGQIRFTDLLMGEDLEFLGQVLSSGRKISYFNQLVYLYRKPEEGLITQTSRAIDSINHLVPRLISIYKNAVGNNRLLASIISKQSLSFILKRTDSKVTSKLIELTSSLSTLKLSKKIQFLAMFVLLGIYVLTRMCLRQIQRRI